MSDTPLRLGKSIKEPKRQCPCCQKILDGATEIVQADLSQAPKMPVGSITVCAYCFAVLEVQETSFREVTEDERRKIFAAHPYMANIIQHMKEQR